VKPLEIGVPAAIAAFAAWIYFRARSTRLRKQALPHHSAPDRSSVAGPASQDVTGEWALGARHTARGSAADRVLEQQLRKRLGRARVHPGGVEVSVVHGRATLSGAVPADEAKEIFRVASSVRGVNSIVDRLQVRERDQGDESLES
jgi:hypothetical protein